MAKPISPLPAAEITTLQAADRARVATALSSVLPLSEAQWFPRGNGYVPNASERIESDCNSITRGRQPNFLRYVAGSVFTHCGDAWSFVGRALDALLRGDLGGAVHLVYYAELRAALSLLASEGVFVGNYDHFAVAQASVVRFGKGRRVGTHTFAWQALQAWTDGPRAMTVFSQVVRPGAVNFGDWVSSLTSRSAQAKVDAVFKLMSIDLREFDNDHRRRNTASYNPSRLRPRDMPAFEIRDLVADVWRALEPGPSGAFPVLDDALLPALLRSIYGAVQRNGVAWDDWVASLAPASQSGSALLESVRANGPSVASAGLVGAMFTSRATGSDATVFLRPMLARTVLLLRIATGSAIQLLRDSGHGPTSLSAWVESLAEARGLWPDGTPLDDPRDLWADVEVALDEADAAGTESLHELLRGLPTGVLTLGQAERVPVWSFV